MKISLNDLPEHHPYRNTKLKDLEVFYRKEGTTAWQEIFASCLLYTSDAADE